jgi:hypothetical protein
VVADVGEDRVRRLGPGIEEVYEEGSVDAWVICSGRPGGLGREGEVEADCAADTVQGVPHAEGRKDVDGQGAGHCLRVVQRGAEGYEGAAVVTGQGETAVSQLAGEAHDVPGHGPLGSRFPGRFRRAWRWRRSLAGRDI